MTGRNTQGVIVWRDREPDDFVASIACFQESDTQNSDVNNEDEPGTKAKVRAKSSKANVKEVVETEAIVKNEEKLMNDDIGGTDDDSEETNTE